MINNKIDLLNYLIDKYNYQSYLEIGVRDPKKHFNNIKINHKIGVDPAPLGKCEYIMTSDDFFLNNEKKFDLIFIDGLHLEEQVEKDILNSLKYLNDDGAIVLHDCNPSEEINQILNNITGISNGTVWKSFVKFRMELPDLYMTVVDAFHGMGIIKRGYQEVYIKNEEDIIDFEYFKKHRTELLNLISLEEFNRIF